MAMLAERKRKQRWSLNPRGNSWTTDDKKFGKRMLEKMGWKDGKGLGAKEDGAVDHIKVSCNNDSNGLGFKENGEQWTAHEDNFTTLLKSLDPAAENAEEPLKTSGTSLEEKSQKSRVRVHYHKFTRGKDLTRYSEKDLANIFGKKTLKPAETPCEPETAPKTAENTSNLQTIERGSMVDYFKQKFPHFSTKRSYEIGANGVLKSTKCESDSESEPERKCGFGFTQPENSGPRTSFVSYVKPSEAPDFGSEETGKGAAKKGKKKRKIVGEAEETDAKRQKVQETDAGCVNPAFDPLARTKIAGVKHSLTTIAEDEETVEETSVTEEKPQQRSKKNKKEATGDDCFVAEAAEKNDAANPREVKRKTKKKDRQMEEENGSSCFSNEILDNSGPFLEELAVNATGNADSNPYEVKRKPKKRKNKEIDAVSSETAAYCNAVSDEPEVTEVSEETKDNYSEFEVKRKPKKSKSGFKEAPEGAAAEKPGKKRKKDKENIETGLDNPNLSISGESESLQPAYSEFEVRNVGKTDKKRKKDKENIETGLDNPNLNVSGESESLQPAYSELEVRNDGKAEKKRGKRSKPKESGLDNPCLNLSREENDVSGTDLTVSEANSTQEPEDTGKASKSSEKKPKKRSKKTRKRCASDNTSLSLASLENIASRDVSDAPEADAAFQTPIADPRGVSAPESSAKRKKSVRFNDRNEERTIPALPEPENGLDNCGFDLVTHVIDEGVKNVNEALDSYQNELENDLNEKKWRKQEDMSKFRAKKVTEGFRVEAAGEEDGAEGVVMKISESKLRKFTVTYRSDSSSAKKSYKHLLRSDFLVQFKGTNFREIEGYAVQGSPEKGLQGA